MKAVLTIKGTHCNSCKILIEDICLEVEGVLSCNVDYATGRTEIEYGENVDWQKFKKEVESLGEYRVEVNQ